MTVPSVTSGCEFYDGGANSNPTYAILKAVMPMVPLPEVVIAVERSVVLENHVEPNAPLESVEPSVPLPSVEPGKVGLSVVKLSLEHSISHNIHICLV